MITKTMMQNGALLIAKVILHPLLALVAAAAEVLTLPLAALTWAMVNSLEWLHRMEKLTWHSLYE